MSLPKCKICQLENPPNAHYWETHKIKVQDFFRKYYPKVDLFTQEQLDFTTSEKWLLTDFKNKTNLKNYLKNLKPAERKTYCKDLIIRRKEIKDLKYSLSQVETKSLLFPSVRYLDILFKNEGGYYEVCKSLGLSNKFIDFKTIKKEEFSGIEIKSIISDTREQQKVQWVGLKEELKTLPYGDYTSKLSDNFIYIDRKSAQDFLGTCGQQGMERFKREIERAFLDNAYIIMLIEYDLSKMLGFNYLPFLARHTRATPEFIFSNLRSLCQQYSNFQPIFVENRDESIRLIPLILSNQKIFSKIDLQLLYDSGLL